LTDAAGLLDATCLRCGLVLVVGGEVYLDAESG
jgi:hypothetical protein